MLRGLRDDQAREWRNILVTLVYLQQQFYPGSSFPSANWQRSLSSSL